MLQTVTADDTSAWCSSRFMTRNGKVATELRLTAEIRTEQDTAEQKAGKNRI
jgi:hypothetical protein